MYLFTYFVCERCTVRMSGCIPILFVNLQVVQLVQRMAGQLQSNKLQVVFLINNYREVGNWNV